MPPAVTVSLSEADERLLRGEACEVVLEAAFDVADRQGDKRAAILAQVRTGVHSWLQRHVNTAPGLALAQPQLLHGRRGAAWGVRVIVTCPAAALPIISSAWDAEGHIALPAPTGELHMRGRVAGQHYPGRTHTLVLTRLPRGFYQLPDSRIVALLAPAGWAVTDVQRMDAGQVPHGAGAVPSSDQLTLRARSAQPMPSRGTLVIKHSKGNHTAAWARWSLPVLRAAPGPSPPKPPCGPMPRRQQQQPPQRQQQPGPSPTPGDGAGPSSGLGPAAATPAQEPTATPEAPPAGLSISLADLTALLESCRATMAAQEAAAQQGEEAAAQQGERAPIGAEADPPAPTAPAEGAEHPGPSARPPQHSSDRFMDMQLAFMERLDRSEQRGSAARAAAWKRDRPASLRATPTKSADSGALVVFDGQGRPPGTSPAEPGGSPAQRPAKRSGA